MWTKHLELKSNLGLCTAQYDKAESVPYAPIETQAQGECQVFVPSTIRGAVSASYAPIETQAQGE